MERVDGIQPDCPPLSSQCGQAGQPGALPAYPQISVYGFIGAAAATRPPVSPHVSPLSLSLSLSKTHFLTMCEFMLDLNDTGGV